MMNKEQILKRINELELALNQNLANHNVLLGGLQEAKYWLSEVDKAEVSS